MCPQARQVNLGTGVTQIFITGDEASLEDISVASTEVGLALNKAYAHKNKPMCTRISLCTQEKAKAHLYSSIYTQVVSVVGRRGTGRSQSAERILDEERAFTRAELVNYSTRSIHALDLSIYQDI